MPQNKPNAQPGVTPELAVHGALSYLEIPAAEPKKSAAFYEQVCGWSVEADGDRMKFMGPGMRFIGRWITGRPPYREPGLLPYIYVDHVRAAVDKAAALGGAVVKAPYPEGNLLVATVRDPAGNIIGLWQEAE